MELRHLRYFTAVAEEENVSRAALKLHVSQPGLSRQIRDLESEMGVVLFERGAKSLHLTPAGKVFLPEARAVLARAETAVQRARAAMGETCGELHVGYAPSLTVQILPLALRAFQALFPKVRVSLHDLSTEEMVSQLQAKKLDLVMMVRPPPRVLRGLEHKEIARYPICAAVAPKHPLAKEKSLTLSQIVRLPLIAYRRADYPEYLVMIERLFSRTGRQPRIAEEHDGVTSILAAVESGAGVALVPSCVACMAGPRVRVIPLAAPAPVAIVIAAWRKEPRADAMIQRFVEAIPREQKEGDYVASIAKRMVTMVDGAKPRRR